MKLKSLVTVFLLWLSAMNVQAQYITEKDTVAFRQQGFLTPTSGLWWNPDEPGTGITVAYQKGSEFQHGFVFLVSYHYDANTGEPQWFTLGAAYQPADYSEWRDSGVIGVVEGEFIYTQHGQSPGGPYQAPVSDEADLSVRIEFTAPNRALLHWQGVSRPLELTEWGDGLGDSNPSFLEGDWKVNGMQYIYNITANVEGYDRGYFAMRFMGDVEGAETIPFNEAYSLDGAITPDAEAGIVQFRSQLCANDVAECTRHSLQTYTHIIQQDEAGQMYLLLLPYELSRPDDPLCNECTVNHDSLILKLYFVDYRHAIALGWQNRRYAMGVTGKKWLTEDMVKGSVYFFERTDAQISDALDHAFNGESMDEVAQPDSFWLDDSN